MNVRVNEASINSTSVELFWDPVNDSIESIRGFFRGYQVCPLEFSFLLFVNTTNTDLIYDINCHGGG